jgi:hypothetical protein
MKKDLLMLFGVTDLNEVRILVEVWREVVETISDKTSVKTGRSSLPVTYDSVEVIVDSELGPGQDVFLVCMAPLNLIDRFFRALRQKGLNFTQDFDTMGPVITCRLVPAAPEP